MIKHEIEDKVSQFKDICDYKVTSPCAHHLLDVNEEAELLDYVKDDLFHSLTAKLIFIAKRTRPGIEPAVAVLTKRVAKSNVGYWKKLRRCISYLN